MIKANFKKLIILFSGIILLSSTSVVLAANPVLTTVSLAPASSSISVGSTTQLAASLLDQNGATYTATTTSSWLSDSPAIATVDSAGLVTGISAGTSTISVSVTDGTSTVSGTSNITVTTPASPASALTSMAITPASSSISVGSTTQLTASLFDQNGATYTATTTVTWSSADNAVCTVDASGLVAGVSAGTSTIMATAVSEGNTVTSTANISVTANATSTPAAVIPIHLEIDTATSTLFNGDISVSECSTPNNATSTVNGFCAFSAANIAVGATWSSYGAFVNSIGGFAGDSNNYWLWFLNGDVAQVGIDSYQLQSGDKVLWTIGREPMKISASQISPAVGATTTIKVLGFDANAYNFIPVAGATVSDGVSTSTTDVNGNADILATSTSPVTISASANGFLPSQPITITPHASQATLAIRDGNTLVGPFTVALPGANAPPVLLSPTNSTTTYSIPASSVLAILSSLDASHSEFDITDLQYFNYFGSFMVNCISVPSASSSPACNNWQYAVNGSFPQIGMDGYALKDGDSAFLFFDTSSWHISADKTAVSTSEPFTVTAEKYDPSSNTYVPAGDEIVGAVQFDANFNPTEFATSTADSNGHATLSLSSAGDYSIGIAPGYYPTVSVAVSAPKHVEAGGGGGGVTHNSIDINKASQFLISNESQDGSFGLLLYTDWAAIALAANGNSTDKITSYLKSANSGMYVATDYERHAMALMALGINPYTGTPVNYIQKIVDTFDGTQIGDPGLVNDDIFSLFPLSRAGYNGSDQIIQKITAFILGKQSSDGSWEESADLTAAAIQALSLNSGIGGVSQAITSARSYLSAHQSQDGGFGTSFSTSWVLQAISALHESQSNWMQNNKTPNDYLYALQASDGGIEPDSTNLNSRIWATSYAIPAALNKSWGDLLPSFAKPVSQEPAASVGGSAAGENSASQNEQEASSTAQLAVATSSIEASSSTVASTTLALVPAAADISVKKIPVSKTDDLSSSKHSNSADNSVNISLRSTAPKISTAPIKELSADGANKEQNAAPRATLPGLAGIAVFGHNLLNFAADIGSLIVSKFFSIIGIK